MKLLERQPEMVPAAPPAGGAETPPDQPPAEAPARACATCGAAMDPGQDWCLQCGTAAGPLGERPGWRSAMTVLGLTLVLVAGAVGASFAALSDDRPATTPAATTGAVAQVPPPAPTTAPPAATTTTPPTGTATQGDDLPSVDAPPSGTRPGSGSSPRPVRPSSTGTTRSTPPAVAPPAPSTPSAPSGSSGSGSTGSGSTGSDTSGSGTATGTPTKRPAPAAIDLAGDAASVYDPYGRATATGAPERAIDGEAGTSWYADWAAGAQQVNVGYALNLGEQRGVRVVEITTPTPGFRVEVYASDEATPPPNILDTRWAHITDKSEIGTGEGGTTRIVLGAGSSKYQTLLLWITTPPSDGTRVRISELKVLG